MNAVADVGAPVAADNATVDDKSAVPDAEVAEGVTISGAEGAAVIDARGSKSDEGEAIGVGVAALGARLGATLPAKARTVAAVWAAGVAISAACSGVGGGKGGPAAAALVTPRTSPTEGPDDDDDGDAVVVLPETTTRAPDCVPPNSSGV